MLQNDNVLEHRSLIMAERHFGLKNYGAAIDHFLEYLADHGKSGRAWYGLGQSFLRIADVNEAERCFDLAWEYGWREPKPIGELRRAKGETRRQSKYQNSPNRKRRKKKTKKSSRWAGFGPQRRGKVSLRTGRRR